MPITVALIDSGPLIAYYNAGDNWHSASRKFFETFKGKLITTEAIVTEVMSMLDDDWRVQNEFLKDLAKELYEVPSLVPSDFKYIAKLNEKYKDLPGDFADLSLVALAERLALSEVVSLDKDFDIYKTYSGKRAFKQVFPKYG
jgi:predicted nucleic acid-binding protein